MTAAPPGRPLWKRALGLFGFYVLAWFVTCVPVGLLGSSNVVWGEPNQYGALDLPGTKALRLPPGNPS